MSRYRQASKDASAQVAEVSGRVSRLERTPQLVSSTIDSGSLSVTGGQIQVAVSDDINAGGYVRASGNTVSGSSIVASLIAGRKGGAVSLQVDGTGSDDIVRPSITMNDKRGAGQPIFQDSPVGWGLTHPMLSSTWYDPTYYKSTMSTSFVAVARVIWNVYHPNLLITCAIKADAGSTGVIQVVESYTGNVVATEAIPDGSDWDVYLVVQRYRLEPPIGVVNGTNVGLDVQYKRASGSGTVYARVSEVVGIDVAEFYP